MLQQTQVQTVIPYFERFIERFPNVSSLAEADQDEVLHLWTGLGYYARARNLQKSAITLKQNFNAELPASQAELEALPGIGRSTAGAILALAYQQQATILDGNVKRVLARYKGIAGWPGEKQTADKLWLLAESLTPKARVANYTQAIMDIGATLCRRSKPQCEECPFHLDCYAYQNDLVADLPGKKPKKVIPVRTTTMLLIHNADGELLLQKRPAQGLWGGLWSFPECDDTDIRARLDELNVPDNCLTEALPQFRHTFTHFHLDISPLIVKLAARDSISTIDEAQSKIWYDANEPPKIGLTRPVTILLAQLALTGKSK